MTERKDNTSTVIVRLPSAKFWPKQVLICQEHCLRQEIHRLRTNPDSRNQHPAECRSNPEGKVILHPETKIRILKQLEQKIQGVNRPQVIRPTRYNRS